MHTGEYEREVRGKRRIRVRNKLADLNMYVAPARRYHTLLKVYHFYIAGKKLGIFVAPKFIVNLLIPRIKLKRMILYENIIDINTKFYKIML